MHISEIDTPAVVINLDVMERNLRRVADYAASHNLRLRPHTKTHKTPALGKKQLVLGAAGLTVAKVGEAEVMLAAEPRDLLVAYPVLGKRKLERLMAVARKTEVTVALDCLFAARQLSEAAVAAGRTIGVLAEADAGFGRVGVDPGEQLLDLVRGIKMLPGLRFDGIEFYPGHIKLLDEEGMRTIGKLNTTLRFLLGELRTAGIEPRIVSGGSTPTLFHSHQLEGLNEIRPGTYIFNDRNTVSERACALEDCAACVLATVISTARPGQAIIDGGSKTFSSDRLAVGGDSAGFGLLVDDPRAVFTKMNEEHGYVDIRNCDRKFSVGDRVHMIPNHICVVVNLHERLYGVRGETVEHVWTVEARGKLQ